MGRLARRAGALVLLDVDPAAARAARRHVSLRRRRRVAVVAHDVTLGAADAVVSDVRRRREPRPRRPATDPLPGAPYDVVVGDLFYSQLLYPALLDAEVAEARIRAALVACAPALTRAAVARMHASAPDGVVVHVHDPIAWWDGHPQPVTLAEVLAAAARDPEAAVAVAARGRGPRESDPRAALRALGLPVAATAVWHWPFLDGVDYVVAATVSPSARR